MRTLEEVKAHVNGVGYEQLAISKIEGFLLGNGLLGDDFEMEYMSGEHTFEDFRKWFNSEKKQPKDKYVKMLKEQLEGMTKCVQSIPDDTPFKLFASGIKDEFHRIVERIEKEERDEEDENEALDKLEVRAKVSVENMVASVLSGELCDGEKDLVLGTLEALVLLGDEYAN